MGYVEPGYCHIRCYFINYYVCSRNRHLSVQLLCERHDHSKNLIGGFTSNYLNRGGAGAFDLATDDYSDMTMVGMERDIIV